MNEEELRKTLAANLVHYRKLANLTQGELAEILNYSDKSVSKWERGEGIPDLIVLSKLASLYHITLNDFVSVKQKRTLPNLKLKRLLVTLLSTCLVWVVAVFAFVILNLVNISLLGNNWLCFIYAIPLSAVIVLVLSSVWGNKVIWSISTSFLVWGILLSVYLSLFENNFWEIFLLGIPLQALVIMWFFFRSTLNKVNPFNRKGK